MNANGITYLSDRWRVMGLFGEVVNEMIDGLFSVLSLIHVPPNKLYINYKD